MSNELLDAAGSSEDDSSEQRYQKLKKEQAGTDQDAAEKRYDELKEEAKQELIERKRMDTQEAEEEESPEEKIEDEKEDGFVTY